MTSIMQIPFNSFLSVIQLPILLAQESDTEVPTGGIIGGVVGGVLGLLVAVIMIAALWKVFTKAGKPGWASIIPIYNYVVMLQIAGFPGWYAFILLLAIVPIINFIAGPAFLVLNIFVCIRLAQRFGKGGGFAVGLILLPIIFFPILGFGSAQYQGAPAAPAAAA